MLKVQLWLWEEVKVLEQTWCLWRLFRLYPQYTKPSSSTLFTKLLSSEDPMFFCNFSTVWCGRLLILCFLGFWNYNSVIQALVASNILCLFISTEVTRGHGTSPRSLITYPASKQCHLLSIVGGPFFKFTTFRT